MKKQIIIGLSLVYGLILSAQTTSKGLHFDIGRGSHSLSFTPSDGLVQEDHVGYTFNAGYDYFFSPSFGLRTGLGLQSFSGISILNLSTSAPAIDELDRDYVFNTKFTNWQEKQNLLFMDIPLALQYRYRVNSYYGFVGSIGGKISLPIYSKYESTGDGRFETTGYYSQWNTTISDAPSLGFDTYTKVPNGHSPMKVSYAMIADLGGFIKTSDKSELYVGLYLNYGLNSINKSSKTIYQSNAVYNGVLSSTLATKIVPISFGVKVGINIDLEQKKVVKKMPEPAPKPKVEDDSDGDGVIDSKDLCPNTPAEAKGKVDANGCPLDTDGDGIPDYLDKCPDTPKESYGRVDANGCPLDLDADGVPDYLDKCPATPREAKGKVDINGCPLDTDGDGIPDYLDKCPGTPKEALGRVDASGCPMDTDGDGVPDYLDKCPDTPKEASGFVDANGCPLDSDGDGILDYLDKCPKVFGVPSNQGCPEVKKEVKVLFEEAKHGIKFETGKQVINAESFEILNKIASTLIQNPNYTIEVQGHTDNVGRPEVNLSLSEKRANAVKQYLVNAGVDAKRLTSNGYGDKMPVATNATPEGKALNRRVEFLISFVPIEN